MSKLLARLESIAVKEEAARSARLAELQARIEKEKAKVKELTLEDDGLSDLFSLINNTAEKNGVSVLKLMDFAAKHLIGETAKVMYRRKREPKVPKEPNVVAAKKVPAAKKK